MFTSKSVLENTLVSDILISFGYQWVLILLSRDGSNFGSILRVTCILVYDHIYHLSVMLFSSLPFSNMQVLLLKRNGSEIARKVP